MSKITLVASAALISMAGMAANAAPVYLNYTNTTVAVGAGTSAGTFNNTFANGNTIGKVIDSETADSEEFHNQTTHIWFTADQAGGGLELNFTFDKSYDISTLHFWNYDGEGFDVDDVQFSFFNEALALVGSLGITPALGTSPAITAQDIALAAPLNVRYVTAFLTGTNRQVDFQNIGFTAEVSAPPPPPPPTVPLPAGLPMLFSALIGMGVVLRRKKSA